MFARNIQKLNKFLSDFYNILQNVFTELLKHFNILSRNLLGFFKGFSNFLKLFYKIYKIVFKNLFIYFLKFFSCRSILYLVCLKFVMNLTENLTKFKEIVLRLKYKIF